MNIDTVTLQNKNKLMTDYQKSTESIMQFFDYQPFNDYKKRVQHLHERNFKRQELANSLLEMNKQWGAPDATIHNIEQLTDERSVAVIGGQQAGLLTGPMYTLNKIISIIQFAKKQEKELQVPVIPVFWIAGEDHDFDEINHIHLFDLPEMKKHQIPQFIQSKLPISNIKLDQQAAKQWIDELFYQLRETEVTKNLYESIIECLAQSTSYVDFFARLLFSLFTEEGLVLIDSNNPQIRKIESDYFEQLIINQEQLAADMLLSAQQVQQSGYQLSLDIDADDAHLFYHHNEERILLKRTKDGQWVGKQDEVKLTTNQLIKIAREKPHLLSNNVVTRPLMQEMLFPTLAFIGGWGEISYWTVLKRAFHTLEMTMPPVVPRLSFSFVNEKTVNILDKHGITYEHIINNGVKEYRANWLAAKHQPPIELLADQVKQDINAIHHPLRSIAKQIRSDIGELADKNMFYLQKEIDFLIKQMSKAIKQQYERELNEFATIEGVLHPYGGLQERVWNPTHFINIMNTHFISELINTPLSFRKDHYIVFL